MKYKGDLHAIKDGIVRTPNFKS